MILIGSRLIKHFGEIFIFMKWYNNGFEYKLIRNGGAVICIL
jgi:hypothetical protein